MRTILLLAAAIALSAVTAQSQGESPNIRVIYGTVVAIDGTPAKQLTLNAEPLGTRFVMSLPRTKTNDAGVYRFDQLPFGRYTVYVEDKKAGFSIFSTGVAGAGRPPEVELTEQHPQAEFNVHLPPPAGYLFFHLTDRSTGAPISGIEVTVMSDETTPNFLFSESCNSTEAILVSSNRN